jgi:arylsulfatase A-like enzyme
MLRYLLPLLLSAFGSVQAEKPHIILVMADDMGWGQTGYRGHDVLKTPNLDAMAANGLRFERFYAGCPVCSPTRASVLTGRSPDRAGVLSHGYGLRHQEKTLAQALKAAGYTTGHFGKWHLNGFSGPGAPVLKDDPKSPGAFGFDEWVSATNFIDRDPYLGRQGIPEQLRGDSSDIVVDEAGKFLTKHASTQKPLFAVLWYGSPHSPFRASEEDAAPFAHLDKESAHHYGELVALDRSIGTLRAKLRELNIAENTLLFFCSDNGGLPGITPGTTGGLRGNKGLVYEGGLRVPGILEWPAVVKPRLTNYRACTMDLFPTIADIVALPDSSFIQPVDGISLKPLLTEELPLREAPLGWRFGKKIALIQGHTKILREKGEDYELYDLAKDQGEQQDLRETQPVLYAEMKEKIEAWNASVEASFQGKDYAEGKVSPPDPESMSWTTSPAYAPWLAQWQDYWAYKAYGKKSAKKKSK